MATMVIYATWAVQFPASTGDIASNGTDGWNGAMPGTTALAQFAKSDSGAYTVGSNVEFGSIYVQKSATFNLHTSGNHTVKLANFSVAENGKTAVLNGGVWDISGTTSGTANQDVGTFASCNKYSQYKTTLVLANSCIVTNAERLIVSNGGGTNTIRISDSSRVYTARSALFNNAGAVDCLLEVSSGGVLTLLAGNLVDSGDNGALNAHNRIVVTGDGSKIICPRSIPGNNPVGFAIGYVGGRNSLLVDDGGEVVAPYRLSVGHRDSAYDNRAEFRNGAILSTSDLRVGEYGACGNMLEIRDRATATVSGVVYVGGYNAASSGNIFNLNNATMSCARVAVSFYPGSYSNAFYIAGSDTSFTATITNLPRYPFVDRGAYNTFEMDGAEWNYWLNMQLDTAAASNTIRFVNGARMNMLGGLYSGTNHTASCGNNVYIGNGAQLKLSFLHISRFDNVFTVSNATLTAFGGSDTTENARGIRFGLQLLNVDESSICGNGLILQGDSPNVSSEKDFRFYRGSFLRFEMPNGGYAVNHVPIMAETATFDGTVSLEITCQAGRLPSGTHTLISTTGGITVPAAVLAAANANLAVKSGGMAKLALANGNKDLVLKVARGMTVSIR